MNCLIHNEFATKIKLPPSSHTATCRLSDRTKIANGTSVWIAPLEMDSPGARIENGVGVGATYEGRGL